MTTRKILLVDDNHDMHTIGQQLFAGPGYVYLAAESGQEGLNAIRKQAPDVVILDYLLPDMNGRDLIEEVATSETFKSLRSTPFLVLTAWEEDLEKLRPLYQRGLVAYLTKPFGARELRCVVENIIQRRGAIGLSRTGNGAAATKLEAPGEELIDLANSVVGLSRILLENLDGEIQAEHQIDLAAIHNCGRRLLAKLQAQAGRSDRPLNGGGGPKLRRKKQESGEHYG